MIGCDINQLFYDKKHMDIRTVQFNWYPSLWRLETENQVIFIELDSRMSHEVVLEIDRALERTKNAR